MRVRPGLIPALHCGTSVRVILFPAGSVRPGLIPALHCGEVPQPGIRGLRRSPAGIDPGPPLRLVIRSDTSEQLYGSGRD